jgi:predicted nucleotidyltransferase
MNFGLQQKHINAIHGVFALYPGIQMAILYGSRAMGHFKHGSDIDIVLIDADLSFPDFIKLENDLDDLLLPYKIDLSQKRKISNPELMAHIEKEGKVFYEKALVKAAL